MRRVRHSLVKKTGDDSPPKKKLSNGKSAAKINSRKNSIAAPELFHFFPFATLFLPAVLAHAEKASPGAALEN